MRLCASLFRRRRGPAGPRDLFASAEVAACTPCAQCFPNVRDEGWYHYPRSVLRGSETLRGRDLKRQTLPLLGLGRMYSQRTQKACGTAMRSCASLFRGVAAPLGCVIPLLFLSPHRWASRFCLSMITARREHICCFHTLVCSMRLATRCRSFALSTASICR